MNPYIYEAQMADDRRRMLLRQAEKNRLARLSQVYRPGLGGRVLATLGAWMIEEGTRLKARYEAARTELPVASYQLSVKN